MKKNLFFLSLFTLLLASEIADAKEVHLRGAYQFGVIGRAEQTYFNRAFKKMILVLPEGNLSWQLTNRWFLSGSFTYARLRDKPRRNGAGVFESQHVNMWGPTLGLRVFSTTEEPAGGGDFFDVARWWSALEFGPYWTSVVSHLLGNNQDVDFGFNFGAGFDYYFTKRLAFGLQAKLHVVTYSPDDYMLFSFGPNLVGRFF